MTQVRAGMISNISVQQIIPREDLKARKFEAVSLLYVRNKIRSLSVGGQYAASSFCGIDENSFKLMKWDIEESTRETPVMPVQALKAQRN